MLIIRFSNFYNFPLLSSWKLKLNNNKVLQKKIFMSFNWQRITEER